MSVNFILTASGGRFYFDDVTKNEINLDDIAHHLSKVQRCGGAAPLDKCYSVAEHSVIVAQEVYKRTRSKAAMKAGLFHDASEAYLGDVVSPLKQYLPDYRRLEEEVSNLIRLTFKITTEFDSVIKKIDKGILFSEMQQLKIPKTENCRNFYRHQTEIPVILGFKTPKEAKRLFLDVYKFIEEGK